MNNHKIQLQKLIEAASKRAIADLVIKNGKVIDVFNQTVTCIDVAIKDGKIIGLGQYEGVDTIDAAGKYVCPGFIDGHVHIESSMVTPPEFAKIVLPHGVTTVIADPHEIGNVNGVDGIKFMLDSSEDIPLDVLMMLPSCVPATPFENAGAKISANDLEPLYQHKRVLGLGEVMDYPSVHQASDHMLSKIISAQKKSLCIDGHAAGVDTVGLNVYMTAGIRTDHECIHAQEVHERLLRGMYVMLREGSAARDLRQLLKAVNEKNARRCLFVTDDKHLDDLIAEGSIDYNVRVAIEEGLDPLIAFQIATINAAECFGLKNKGAIAPGYDADILLLESLENVQVHSVIKAGKMVVEDGKCLPFSINRVQPIKKIIDSVRMKPITVDDLQVNMVASNEANIIQIIPNSIVTKKVVEEVDVIHDCFMPSTNKDQLKLVVVERHHLTGNVGTGIVKGLGLQKGAIASTVAHDSHNIVVAGTNDKDILVAIETIQQKRGGLVVIEDGKCIASIPLPIAGLMSDQDYSSVNLQLKNLNDSLNSIGFKGDYNPFLTLSFLALPVIPEIKLTDIGLFDVTLFTHISNAKTV
ncbi:adenine deaminase [Bacillus timonensis]|nr:adenine deaminase [Bacillus timonensis]